jgi:hypothetical protein
VVADSKLSELMQDQRIPTIRNRLPLGLSVAPTEDRIGVIISGSPKPGTRAFQLDEAGRLAEGLAPLSDARIDVFDERVLPVLLGSAADDIFGNPALADALQPMMLKPSRLVRTFGVNPDGTPDPFFPPRAARALDAPFVNATGVGQEGLAQAREFMSKIAAIPYLEGRRGPTLNQVRSELGDAAADDFAKVTETLLGERRFDSLTPKQQALVAIQTLNNLTWHITNWHRGGLPGQETRVLTTARNGTFNTLSDNLGIQRAVYGLDGAANMALIDTNKVYKRGNNPIWEVTSQ